MKLLILFILSFNAYANYLPESEVVKALNKEPNAGSKTCQDLPEETCHNYDGIQWEIAELADNYVLDYIAKENEQSCELLIEPKPEPVEGEERVPFDPDEERVPFNPYKDCDDKFIELSCSIDSEKIKNYETLSVYCAVEVMKVDGKKLVESAEKKAAYKAARKAEKDAEQSAKEAKKALKLAIKEDVKTATTVAKLKVLIEKLIEAQDEK